MSEQKLPTFPPGTLKMLKPIQQERDGYFDVEYRFVSERTKPLPEKMVYESTPGFTIPRGMKVGDILSISVEIKDQP